MNEFWVKKKTALKMLPETNVPGSNVKVSAPETQHTHVLLKH
jgi:hypothetical protein